MSIRSCMPGRNGPLLVCRLLAATAFVLLAAILSLSRQRGYGALDTLWAEDASIFLQQALDDASPAAWLTSYAGYAHLLPRVLGGLSTLLPLDFAPWVLSGGAALVTGLLALFTFHAAAPAIPRPMMRLAIAACVVALPSTGSEVMNSSANLHWYLLFAASWAALWRPADHANTVAASVVLFVSAASDPFAILLVPVVLWQLVREPRASDAWRAAALGAGLVIQAAVILLNDQPRDLDPSATAYGAVLQWYGYHVLMTSVFGVTFRDWLVMTLGVLPTAALALAILGSLLVPALQSARRSWFVPAALAALHLGFYFVPVILAGTNTPRYAVAPILLLYSLIAWGLAASSRPVPYRSIAAAVLLTIIVAVDFGRWNMRADGPGWTAELERARARCEADRGSATITVPPSGDLVPVGWMIVVPCDRI